MATKIARGQATIIAQEDQYTITLSIGQYVFASDQDGKVVSAVSVAPTIQVIQGKDTPITSFTIGSVTSPTGMTATVDNTAKKVTFSVAAGNTTLADNGSVLIPVIVNGTTYNQSFSWSKTKAGKDSYTVLSSRQGYVVATDPNGSIESSVSTSTVITALKGATAVTPTIGTLPTVAGCSLSKTGTTVNITFNTGSGLANNGTIDIPVTVDGKSFTVTFAYSKAKRGATGAAGVDANLLDWVQNWNSNKTTIGADSVVTPKIFSGSKNADGTLTGIAIGQISVGTKNDAGAISTENLNGIFGFNNGYKTFGIDSTGAVLMGRGREYLKYNPATGKIEFGPDVSLNWTNAISTAKSDAISAAASDAQTKADAAKAAAISTAAADAKAKADAVQTNLDNLQVGSRNLITLSAYSKTYAGFKYTNGRRLVSGTLNRINFSGESSYTSNLAKCIAGSYSVSFWFKVENYISGSTVNVNIADCYISSLNIGGNKGWTFFSATNYVSRETFGFVDFEGDWTADVTLSDIVICRGSNPSANWYPAPEDVDIAIASAKAAGEAAQTSANAANTSVSNLSTYVDGAFKDGIVSTSEAQAIDKLNKQINTDYDAAINDYNIVYASTYLTGTAKSDLSTAKSGLTAAKDALQSSINTAIADGKTTSAEKSDVDAKFASYATKFKDYQTKLSAANKAIQQYLDTLSTEKVNNLQIGGRNLVLQSNKGWTSVSYNVMKGYLPENWVVGQEYTITVKGTCNTGNSLGLWRDGGTTAIAYRLPLIQDGLYRYTFIAPDTSHPEKNSFTIYNYPSSTATTASIEWIKIEKGNKATDWSPAPEDIDASISSAKTDAINTASSDATSKANSAKDTAISTAATDAQTKANAAKAAAISAAATDAQTKADNAKSAAISAAASDATAKANAVQSNLDNLQVGGKNFIRNTKDKFSIGGIGSSNQIITTNKYVVSGGDLGASGFVIGDKAVLSFDWKATKTIASFGTGYFYIRILASNGSYYTLSPSGGSNIYVSDSSNQGRVEIKFSLSTELLGIKDFTPRLVNIPSGVTLDFSNIKLERGDKATDWTPAPEDIEEKIANKTGHSVRYIRDYVNGSEKNNGNHWVEIQAIRAGVNVALNKPVTSPVTGGYLSRITDGDINTALYASLPDSSNSYIQIDLGDVYTDIDYIQVWHYYADGRTYRDTKTEISADGANWTVLFDSAVEGVYKETADGKIHNVSYARIAQDAKDVGKAAQSTIDALNQKAATESWSTKLTYIGSTGIFTGTLSANLVQSLRLDASQINAGTIDAARINVESIKTSILTAGNINALTLDTVRGKIGGWSIDSDSIYRGTKNNTTGAFTGASTYMTIGSNGIRGNKWRLDASGAGAIAGGNISWDSAGTVTFTDAVKLNWTNAIEVAKTTNHGYRYAYNLWIYGDHDKYYPFTIAGGDQNVKRDILIKRSYSETHPAEWNSPTHGGGLTLKLKTNFGGWGGANYSWEVHELEEMYNPTFGGCSFTTSNMTFAIMLRGGGTGGAIYHVYSDQPIETTHSLHLDGDGNSTGVFPQVFYNSDVLQYGTGTYKWTMPAPLTSPQTDEIRKRKFIALAQAIDNSLGGNGYPKLTKIDATGIYTGTVTASQITAGTISADRIGAGSITSTHINTASVQAAVVTAAAVNGLDCTFVKGKIGGWTIGSSAIYNGAGGGRWVILNSSDSDSPAGSNRAHKGLTVFVDDGACTTGQVKVVQMGALGAANATTSWTSETDYGFRILVKDVGDVFRADSSGAKIANWSFDSDSIYRGTKNNTLNGYTSASGSMTIGSNGIRGFKWHFDSDGSGAIAGGKISWDASGNVTFDSTVSVSWTQGISEAKTSASNASTAAANAQSAASLAASAAAAAQGAADSASSAAATAKSTADSASTAAANAQSTANTANTTANTTVTNLGGVGYTKLTKIDANGIYTGTLTADQINVTGIDASKITVGSLSADRIAAGSLNGNKITAGTISADRIVAGSITSTQINTSSIQSAVVTAGAVNGLTCTFTKGSVGGWTIDSDSIYRGTKNNTLNGYTSASGGMTIGSNGIRGFKWHFDSDGSGAVAGGNISWDASGNVTFGESVSLNWNSAASSALSSAKSYADTKKTEAINAASSDATEKINSLQVGGRNLLRNSGNFSTSEGLAHWVSNGSNISIDTGIKYLNKNTLRASGSIHGFYHSAIVLEPNTTYVYSVMVNNSVQINGSGTMPLHMQVYSDENTSNIHQEIILSFDTSMPAGKWKLCWVVFKTPITASTSTRCYMIPYLYMIGSEGMNMAWAKVEKGNKPTDWSPAQEDVDAATAAAKSTADSAVTALGGSGFPKLTKIDSSGIYTGTLTANQVNVSGINAGNITTGTMHANRIQAGTITSTHISTSSIQAAVVTAAAVNGLTCSFTKGTIGGWSIASNQISGGSTIISSTGSITNGNLWKLNSDGSGQLANGNISWTAAGALTLTGKVTSTSGSIGGWTISSNTLTAQSGSSIYVEHNGSRFLRINGDPNSALLSLRADGGTGINVYTQDTSGIGMKVMAQTYGTAIESYGSVKFYQRYGETWCMPGVLVAGVFKGTTSGVTVGYRWGEGMSITSISRINVGTYRFYHNLNRTEYTVIVSPASWSYDGKCNKVVCSIENYASTYFDIKCMDFSAGLKDITMYLAVIGRPYQP